MSQIKVKNFVYKVHPVYNMYAASKDGKIIHIVKKNPMDGNLSNTSYRMIMVRKRGGSKYKGYYAHRLQ